MLFSSSNFFRLFIYFFFFFFFVYPARVGDLGPLPMWKLSDLYWSGLLLSGCLFVSKVMTMGPSAPLFELVCLDFLVCVISEG